MLLFGWLICWWVAGFVSCLIDCIDIRGLASVRYLILHGSFSAAVVNVTQNWQNNQTSNYTSREKGSYYNTPVKLWFGLVFLVSHKALLQLLVALEGTLLGVTMAAGCNKNDWKHPYSPPILSCLQFLLDVLQGKVPLWGAGDAVGNIRHGGGGLQDDLKGLAWGSLVNGLDVHVCMCVH